MAYILLPSRLTRQPQGAVGIDWSHPLARGLVFYASPLSNWLDIVGGLAPTSNSSTRQTRKDGVVADLSGTTQYIDYASLALANGITMACHFIPDAWDNAGAFGVHGLFAKGQWGSDAAGDIRLTISGNRSSSLDNTVSFEIGTGGSYGYTTVSTLGLATGVPYVAVGSLNGTTASLWMNSLASTPATVTAISSAGTNPTCIGAYPGNQGNTEINAAIYWAAAWSGRALSEPEARELIQYPYSILKPITRRIFVGTAAAGGGALTGASTGSFAVSGSASGQVAVAGSSAGTFTLSGAAAGAVAVAGTSLAAFTLTGTSAGTVASAAAVGESSAAFTVTGSAAGTVLVAGVSTGAFAVSGSAAGALRVDGASAAAFDLTGSATGTVSGAGVAIGESSAAFTLTGTAAGAVSIAGDSIAAFALSAAGTAQILVDGLSAGSFAVSGTGEGTVYIDIEGESVGSFDILGSATGTIPVTAVQAGGGAGWPIEEEAPPRVKSTRERIRDIIEELDEAAEEMAEAVGGEAIREVAPRPVDVAAIADRMTPRLARSEPDDDDEELLLLSH